VLGYSSLARRVFVKARDFQNLQAGFCVVYSLLGATLRNTTLGPGNWQKQLPVIVSACAFIFRPQTLEDLWIGQKVRHGKESSLCRVGSRAYSLEASRPDEIRNGLALCAIHHKALDRGAIGISEDLRVLISAEIHGQSLMTEWFQSFSGGAVRKPTRADWEPRAEYIKWHTDQVFRKPARD
jgi:hypothetical protein